MFHGLAAIDLVAIGGVLYRTATHRTDYRWADLDRHVPDWDDRTRMMAKFIPIESTVVEFGCGRRVLEEVLPPGCRYIPSDIVSRGPDTWVCDLNRRPLPPMPQRVDVAVFSGVLEYVYDLSGVVEWLARSNVTTIVASYGCVRPFGLSRAFDTVTRLRFGWVTNCSEDELNAMFEQAGYRVERRDYWRDQLIGRFVRNARGDLHRE